MNQRRARTSDAAQTALNEAVGIDCYYAEFPESAAKVTELGAPARFRLLPLCDGALKVPRFRIHDPTRVASAKLLVALLPDSLSVIKRWMTSHAVKSIYEIHFSLLCYLDEVQHFTHLVSSSSEVLKIVASYLMETRSNAAHSAWMAGDLLGDHWHLRESLPLLTQAAKGARSTVGRVAAVDGLSMALARCSDADYARINATLEQIAECDPSRTVRETADWSLKKAEEALSAL